MQKINSAINLKVSLVYWKVSKIIYFLLCPYFISILLLPDICVESVKLKSIFVKVAPIK